MKVRRSSKLELSEYEGAALSVQSLDKLFRNVETPAPPGGIGQMYYGSRIRMSLPIWSGVHGQA